ncbi:MAG TPA: RnfABCDGE type electron transport complex subunit D, partial [Limnochordia bacterium]|nr:RnfABCDGE type electron transport complex subunit D [Limnochordia bacterium]
MQIKTGPFLRSPLTIKRIMIDVLIALTPAAIAGLIFFGLPALKVLVLSTLSAVLTEAILLRAPLTPQGIFGDGSAAVTGLLLGLILPPTVSWWVPVVGSVLAIALVKLAFGGLGHNIFNPALGARAILLLAFTSQLVKFTAPFDAVTTATPLLSMRSFSWSLVWGNVGGSIGETSVIAILLGGAYLLYKGHINWRNPLGYVGSAFVLALLWGLDPWYTITAGGLLFAAVFMATDMVTSPVTSLGQFIFGIGCGVLTMVIRQFTSLPEGVTFAVLTMNALSPALESLTIPRIFGLSISQETWKKGIAVTTAAVVVFAGFLVLLDRSEPSAVPVFSRGQYLPIAELLGAEDYEVVENNGTTYYLVRDEEGNPLQTVFVAEQGGFNGPIRFLLALDAEHRIAGVRVLEHREDPGLGELATRPAFLEQFVGLDQDSSFSIGAGIQAVTGATISSRALATGVERALVQFNRAFFPADEAAVLVDGTYFGQADSFGGLLELEVVVEDGKITAVNVLRHSDTPGISDPAYNTIPQRIVQANSPQVDAASGATVSSQAIIKAVEQALAQAAGEPASAAPAEEEAAAYPDGTYYGQADSFGGKLELEVVVEGGRIAAVNVLQHSDTPGISDLAYQ